MGRKILLAVALMGVGLTGEPARAAGKTVLPGETFSLDGDLVLMGTDSFIAGDPAGARCKIVGNGHGILVPKGTDFTGSVIIRNCDIEGLGAVGPDKKLVLEAFLMTIAGDGKFIIEDSTLSKSTNIEINVSQHVDVVFRGNTILADAIVPELTLLLDSPPVFWSTGQTDGMKLFQGNLIEKGRAKFTSTSDWTIGGSMPGEGNVMIGTRVGIELENASLMTIRGNYSHTLVEGDRWNQVKNLSMNGGDGNTIEHNVFWGRNWLVEADTGGEIRYNLLIDAAERGWVLTWTDVGAKIHHNVAIATQESKDGPTGGIVVEATRMEGGAATTEAYNNTFDLGGKCNPGVGAAVLVRSPPAFLLSVRSNAFTGVRVAEEMGAALIRADDPTQPVERLGYADYNLFFTPDSPVKKAYGATVEGKTARADAGFGMNDLPKGGAADAQVDPAFTGPIPRTFPFDEMAIRMRATTVCQILAYYRQVYTPADGSPLIDAGDPADGDGNDVGAVGAGTADPADQFGRLCDDITDVGTPMSGNKIFMCTTVPIGAPMGGDGGGGGEGGGGGGNLMRPHGITCVCDASAATPNLGPVALGAGLALGVLARRRRKAPGRR